MGSFTNQITLVILSVLVKSSRSSELLNKKNGLSAGNDGCRRTAVERKKLKYNY